MIRIVFTADNHLNRYYAKMSRDQLRERRKRIRQAWRETVDFAIQSRAHFYLHAGDLFDGPDPNPGELAFVAREFQRMVEHGIQILAISGNHDMPRYMGESASPIRIYQELRAARAFTRRTEAEFDTFDIDGTRIAIGGLAPDPRADPTADPLEGVEINPPPADVRILLLHSGVEDAVPEAFAEAVIRKSRIAALKSIDYFLVGDIHQNHKLTVDHATVLIPGATERMNFGELKQEPGFYYIELEGKRPVKLIRKGIGPQPMRRIEVRSTNLPSENPTDYIAEEIRAMSYKDQLLQLQLGGPIDRDVYHQLRFFDIWRLGNELNFFFDLEKSGLELRTSELERAGLAPDERVDVERELVRVAAEMQAEAESEPQRERIADAGARVLQMYRRGKE
ncbi:MAG: metallophosphoesterase [Anaerolineae bacterium]